MNGQSHPKRFVFNYNPTFSVPAAADTTYHYPAAPVVELVCEREESRTTAQIQKMLPPLPAQAGMFNDPFAVAYGEYIVHWLGNTTTATLGDDPIVMEDAQQHASNTLPSYTPFDLATLTDATPRLYLFNVIVAFEWNPTPMYLQQMRWAFKRASDFLYDATDGRMAFGQVVFVDSRYLACADIQVMASNRVMPRSWVGGLLIDDKYMPIRVGRGVWQRNTKTVIGWDEPEGYRTLVHEWAHYALFQRDEYLALVDAQPDDLVLPQAYDQGSIMANPIGSSELPFSFLAEDQAQLDRFYRHAVPSGSTTGILQPRNLGPGALPLALPTFTTNITPGSASLTLAQSAVATTQPTQIYVLKTNAQDNITAVLSQGSFDHDAVDGSFQLLGAAVGDTIVIMTQQADGLTQIKQATYTTQGLQFLSRALEYPSDFAVVPTDQAITNQAATKNTHVAVRVNYGATTQSITLYSSEKGTKEVNSANAVHHVPLDGLVIVRDGNDVTAILDYSQGGGPATTVPVFGGLITAGSANGEALMFFQADANATTSHAQVATQYERIRIVTTNLEPMVAQSGTAAHAVSDVFCIASNDAIPAAIHPTLVMLRDQRSRNIDVCVCRLGSTRQILPTYITDDYVAVSLGNATNGGSLNDAGATEHLEYFQIWTTS